MRVEYGGILRCITSDGRNVNIAEELNRLEKEKRINMSGECESCGEHTTDCSCRPLQGDGIKVWAQMFFEDGSITRGIRMPAEWLDEGYEQHIAKLAKSLLEDLNRDEGWLLIWGAGNMVFKHYPISCVKSPSQESDS